MDFNVCREMCYQISKIPRSDESHLEGVLGIRNPVCRNASRSIHPVSACSVYPVYLMRKEEKGGNPEREGGFVVLARKRSASCRESRTRGRRSLIRTPLKNIYISLSSPSLSLSPNLTLPYLILRHLPFPSASVLRAFCSVLHVRERERARPRL